MTPPYNDLIDVIIKNFLFDISSMNPDNYF